jgi:hypothetical protein
MEYNIFNDQLMNISLLWVMTHLDPTIFDLSFENYSSKVYNVFVGKLGFFTKNSAKLLSHFSDFTTMFYEFSSNWVKMNSG